MVPTQADALAALATALAARSAAVPVEGSSLAEAATALVEDHFGPAARRARAAAAAAARLSGQSADATKRRLARNGRVACAWHDDAWSDDEAVEWYPGLAGHCENDAYDVLFDDGDERRAAPRADLKPVFLPGSFDWSGVFADDDDGAGVSGSFTEAVSEDVDAPRLSSDDADAVDALLRGA